MYNYVLMIILLRNFTFLQIPLYKDRINLLTIVVADISKNHNRECSEKIKKGRQISNTGKQCRFLYASQYEFVHCDHDDSNKKNNCQCNRYS